MHHFGLVGDAVEFHAVGQGGLELGKHLLHFPSEGHDIVALAHLHADDQGIVSIEVDHFGRLGHAAFDGGHIAKADGVARRVRIDDLLFEFLLADHGIFDVQRLVEIVALHGARSGQQAL